MDSNYNKYGSVVIKATEKIKNPGESWKQAIKKHYPNSVASQKKSCPKNTFLGLCEEGLVKGIPKGKYTKSIKNKKYALKAIEILKQNTQTSFLQKELWGQLELGDKSHNSQIDVVLALWEKNYILDLK